jgi:hypothetical protein
MLTLSWHWLDPSAAWVVGVVCGLLALILLAYRPDWISKPMIIVPAASSDAELAVIFLQGERIPPARYQPVAEVPTVDEAPFQDRIGTLVDALFPDASLISAAWFAPLIDLHPRQHLLLLGGTHHPASIFETGDLIEIEVAIQLSSLGIDPGGGNGQVLLPGRNATQLGTHGRQFSTAQIHLGTITEAVVEVAGAGGEHGGVVVDAGLIAHAKGTTGHLHP